jgi:hypothetical protein
VLWCTISKIIHIGALAARVRGKVKKKGEKIKYKKINAKKIKLEY